MKLLCFAGSLRAESYNKLYVKVGYHILKLRGGLEAELVELNDYPMPVYNGDIEKNDFPAPAKALAEKISQAQGVIISSPENNASIAAVLKNTVDWVSRVHGNPWKGKHILLLGASPGALGAVRGLWHARIPFEALGCFVYPEMSGLPKAHEAFDATGALKDKTNYERLALLIDGFCGVVQRK